MRILLAGTGLQVGGAERIVVVLARALVGRRHEVAVSGTPGPLEDELLELPVRRVRLVERGRSLTAVAHNSLDLAAFQRSFRPHVIHAHNPKAAITAALGARLGLGPRRPPLLATVHGLGDADHRAAGVLLRLAADRVTFVSRDAAFGHTHAGAGAEIVHNGVELEPPLPARAREALDQELALDGGPVLGAVGRLSAEKNHARYLAAAAEILRVEPEARFLLVGTGPGRPQLERLAAELGIADRLRFTGARADARALIARVDLLVVSSDREGLSVAALEALAAGTPIVSTPVEGMRTLLDAGAGVIAEDWSATSLARAALDLLADPRRRAAMGKAGMRLVGESFASEAMVDAYERVYADLARKRAA